MPRLRDSLIQLNAERYGRVFPDPTGPARAPIVIPNPPVSPAHLTASTVMISSLPAIATTVDGITRQFYAHPTVPTRRLMVSSQ